MKEADILKDLLEYKIASQISYNNYMIDLLNPEARQLFTQMRDDEMRAITKLQQKITRLESKARIIARILPAKSRQ
jgi:hypothetical protein